MPVVVRRCSWLMMPTLFHSCAGDSVAFVNKRHGKCRLVQSILGISQKLDWIKLICRVNTLVVGIAVD